MFGGDRPSMKIKRAKAGANTFTWEGLTAGKLAAIARALEVSERAQRIGPVGQDVKAFLDRAGVEKLEPNGAVYAYPG